MVDILAPFQAFFYGEISVAEFKTRIRVLLPALETVPPEILEYLDEFYREKRLSEQDYADVAMALKSVSGAQVTRQTAGRNPEVPGMAGFSVPEVAQPSAVEPVQVETSLDLDATVAISVADRKKLFEPKPFMGYLDQTERNGHAKPVQMDADAALTGRVLGQRYQLTHLLHKSAYFLTFDANDQQAITRVFVHVIRPGLTVDHAALVALDRDVKRVQRLQHDGIVPVKDIVRDQQTVFLVTERIEGQSLSDMLCEYAQGMPHKHLFHLVHRIADILQYAHARLVVHANLQPSTIFVTDDGDVRIMDFGLVQALFSYDHRLRRIGSSADDPRTRAMPYASCQILEGAEPTPSDDVFSLACITYEMFVGQHPFAKSNALEARRLSLDVQRHHLSRVQWQGLVAGLAFESLQRFDAVTVLVQAIEPVSGVAKYKYKMLAGVAVVLLLMTGYFGYPVWQDGQVRDIMAQISTKDFPLGEVNARFLLLDGAHKARLRALLSEYVLEQFQQDEAAGLQSLKSLDDDLQASLLRQTEVKAILADYYQAQIKLVADKKMARYDYPAAERIVQEARQFYPNSRTFSHIQSQLLNEKAAVLSDFSKQLARLLRNGKLLQKAAKEDVFDVMARIQQVSPSGVQQHYTALTRAYVSAVKRAPNGQKSPLLEAGLYWVPADQQLLALKRALSSPAQQTNIQPRHAKVKPNTEVVKPSASMLKLLGKLRAAVADNRISQPSANSAVFFLKAMIQLDKDDPSVFLGRSDLSAHYLQLSRSARKVGDLEGAQAYLNLAGGVKTMGIAGN